MANKNLTDQIMDYLNDHHKHNPNRLQIREFINKVLLEATTRIIDPNLLNEEKIDIIKVIYSQLKSKYGFGSLAHEFNIYRNNTRDSEIDFLVIVDILDRAILEK